MSAPADGTTGDTTVRCDGCGREERVFFAECIATGWPTCHGQTMLLAAPVSERTIDRAVSRLFAPATAAARAMRNEEEARSG